jgi:signal transduction histidine kinase
MAAPRRRLFHVANVEVAMTNLTLVSSREAATDAAPAQWAHDLRNLLATIGLHLDTLARLSGPHGAKAVNAAHALVVTAARMCRDTSENRCRQHPFDITATLHHVVDLIAPLSPDGFTVNVECSAAHFVLTNQNDIFRILFNLLNNAVKVARTSHALRRIDVSISRADKSAEVKITDNGPGLPPQVVARLFRRPAEDDATHGHGLAIARELAERNGGTLTCKTSHKGTMFRLELTALTSIGVADDSVTRSLGRRASG